MLTLKNKIMLTALGLLAGASLQAYALQGDKHQVILPGCLLKELHAPYQTLSSTKSLTFIETDDNGINQLSNMKHHQKISCGGFKDVTHSWEKQRNQLSSAAFLQKHTASHRQNLATSGTTYSIKYPQQANQLLQQLTPQNMWSDLTSLTHFKDRYANSDNGVNAAKWIKEQVETIASNHQRKDVTAYFVATGSRYKQPSLVVKVGEGTGPGIVIGGHMDTLSSSFENKPGADDDGSGSVTVLEIARTVISSDMRFKKPVYFVWYAAEEMGLVGSQYVVDDFQAKHIPVDGVMQLDMTGYAYHNEPTMWLMNDHVNKNLTKFLETIITTYVKQPVKYSTCGYACSDHASWDDEGIPATMPFESSMGNDNPDIHTANDVMSNLSLQHMTDYAKLGTAFVVEMAEPV